MIVGLTGSSGILGKQLVLLYKNINFNFFKGDIKNFNQVDKWIQHNDFDLLIHLAAIVPIKKVNSNMQKAYNVNYLGTKNLVDSIKLRKKNKIWFFLASTSHVYSKSKKLLKESSKINPINYYAITKLKAEEYIIKNNKYINYCIGRIFSYTSRHQKSDYFIPNMISKLKSKKKTLSIYGVNHYRDFLPIKDVAKAIMILAKSKSTGIFNICSSKKILLSDIVNLLNFRKKKLSFLNDYPTSHIIGSNRKIKKLNWKPTYKNYLNYLKKYEKDYCF